MSRATKMVLGGVAAVLILFATGFYFLNRASYGILGFYVWRATSGEFHGSHRASVNGISLYYETYGSGPPVLALHGAEGFLETMYPFIEALAPTHTVIAVDSRAQGRSTDSSGPITYGLMADDMIKLMDALHIRQADVVGWSDGGNDGLDMAMNHPDRVRRLVAVGANYDANGVDTKMLVQQWTPDVTNGAKLAYEMIAPDPKHYPIMHHKVMTMIQTQPHYTPAQLGTIRARTLIVAGEHDVILDSHTARMATAIPGAKKGGGRGGSHIGPVEMPDYYGRMAVEFFNAP